MSYWAYASHKSNDIFLVGFLRKYELRPPAGFVLRMRFVSGGQKCFRVLRLLCRELETQSERQERAQKRVFSYIDSVYKLRREGSLNEVNMAPLPS